MGGVIFCLALIWFSAIVPSAHAEDRQGFIEKGTPAESEHDPVKRVEYAPQSDDDAIANASTPVSATSSTHGPKVLDSFGVMAPAYPSGSAPSINRPSSSEDSPGATTNGSEGGVQADSAASQTSDQSRLSMELARLALASGDLVAANQSADDVLRQDPQNASALALQAQVANLRGDFALAEQLARSAVGSSQTSAGLENLALAELQSGKTEQALKDASVEVERSPQSAVAHALLGYAQGALGNRRAAIAELEKAAERDPRFAERLAAAKRGADIFDRDELDASMLLGGPSRFRGDDESDPAPWMFGALFLAVISGFSGFFIFRARGRANAKAQLQRDPVGDGMVPPKRENWRIGKYELGRVIGRGGMGIVYEAFDPDLARVVAIKKMSTSSTLDQGAREAYIKEARIVASLRHPAIVEIYDIVEQDQDVFLVFEFVKGITAHQLLTERGPLSLERATEILRPICAALAFAHASKLVHRDLKPMNIMVTEDGPAKLMDFGIARPLSGREVQTRTETVRGTPVYMAPESWEGVIRPESDIYSLGVSLYEMVTGDLPFPSMRLRATEAFELPSRRISGLPRALDELVIRSLEADPKRRISSALDFLGRLQAALASESKTPV